MPLTTCRDCGREVSTSADACPHCGAPIRGSFRGEGCLSRNRGCADLLLILVGGLVLLMILAACGGDGPTEAEPEPGPEYLNFSGTFFAHTLDGVPIGNAPLREPWGGCIHSPDSAAYYLYMLRVEFTPDGSPRSPNDLGGSISTGYSCANGSGVSSRQAVRGTYVVRTDSILFRSGPIQPAAWGDPTTRSSFSARASIRGQQYDVLFRSAPP